MRKKSYCTIEMWWLFLFFISETTKQKNNRKGDYNMFCPKCGKEIGPGVQFCMNCGAEIPNVGQEQAPVQNQVPFQSQEPMYTQAPQQNQTSYQNQAPQRNQTPKKKKSSTVPILCGVIAVLLVAAVIVLVLVLTKKDEPKQASQQTKTEEKKDDKAKKDDDEAEWTMPPGGGNSEGEFVDEEDFDPDDMPNDHDNETYVFVVMEKLDDATVANLSKDDKRYYVNTLYAYYGYRFENNLMQEFFDSQEWYEPDMSVEPGDQNSISKKFDEIAKYNLKKLT